MGRPWPQPGEPFFLPEDTNLAIALREQEQSEAAEKCHLCGLPRKVCRDGANQYKFAADAERCHATWAILQRQSALGGDDVHNRSLAWSARLPDN